jgi:hypothetical protein
MPVLLVIAAVLNAAGLVLMLGNSHLSHARHLRHRPVARWLSGIGPIVVGAALIFVGVVLAVLDVQRQFEWSAEEQ